jgi:uncharacterized protein YggT (Ycf19 family)
MSPSRFTQRVTQVGVTLVFTLLSLRFLLRLLNADATNRVVQWVYDMTAPAVQPFFNWFPQVRSGDGFVIEVATVFALVSYTFLAFVALGVVNAWQDRVDGTGNPRRRFRISFTR